MICPCCGGTEFIFDLLGTGKSFVGTPDDHSIGVINLITGSEYAEPDERPIHTAVICTGCGDRFLKHPEEWLQAAYARHCQETQR